MLNYHSNPSFGFLYTSASIFIVEGTSTKNKTQLMDGAFSNSSYLGTGRVSSFSQFRHISKETSPDEEKGASLRFKRDINS